MVKSFLKRLILVHNGDVTDLVQLVETLDAMLDELSELDCALNCIGHALNDDVVSGDRTTCSLGARGGAEQLVGALEVAADADATLDADLIGREHLLRLLDALVLVCHRVSQIFFFYYKLGTPPLIVI